jgi:predicted LPLAT superfamily acyltransferase
MRTLLNNPADTPRETRSDCVAVLTDHYLHCLEFKGQSSGWRWFAVESRPHAE